MGKRNEGKKPYPITVTEPRFYEKRFRVKVLGPNGDWLPNVYFPYSQVNIQENPDGPHKFSDSIPASNIGADIRVNLISSEFVLWVPLWLLKSTATLSCKFDPERPINPATPSTTESDSQ